MRFFFFFFFFFQWSHFILFSCNVLRLLSLEAIAVGVNPDIFCVLNHGENLIITYLIQLLRSPTKVLLCSCASSHRSVVLSCNSRSQTAKLIHWYDCCECFTACLTAWNPGSVRPAGWKA